ncbi:MAG: hypothetical protein AAF628_25885 [Planctomycetota bacterium]
MLVKATAIGLVLASTPLFLAATQQDPAATGCCESAAQLEASAADMARLRGELESLRRRAKAARAEVQDLRSQLEESLDMLEASTPQREHRNCSPSRSNRRSLMTQFQWLKTHGHDTRATKLLTRMLKSFGDNPNNLNSVAWNLMTDDETAGKYDDVALALAERMEAKRTRRHEHLDTIALARFLNGQLEAAVKLQRTALKAKNSDDYRRRLRTYEVALASVAKGQASPATAAARRAQLLTDEE